jgi:dihydrolipoamide dehydrogenase
LLLSVGRTPNGKKIAAEKAGVAVSDRGFICRRQPDAHQRRAHLRDRRPRRPTHARAQGGARGTRRRRSRGRRKSYFDARVIPSVAYTDPEIAWVGITEEEAKAKGVKVSKGLFPWAASGRAIANGRDEGFTKLLFDDATHRIVGGGIVGTHAGDLISEIALAIEMGADAVDIGRTIHPHPTLSESVGLAAEAFEGVCTDLPPPRKK